MATNSLADMMLNWNGGSRTPVHTGLADAIKNNQVTWNGDMDTTGQKRFSYNGQKYIQKMAGFNPHGTSTNGMFMNGNINQGGEGNSSQGMFAPYHQAAQNGFSIYKDLGGDKLKYEGADSDGYFGDGTFVGSNKMQATDGNSWKHALGAAAAMAGGAFALQGGLGGMGAGAGTGATGVGGAGVTVGGPMSVGMPVGTALGPAGGVATGGATGGLGGLGGLLGGGGSGGMSLGTIMKGVNAAKGLAGVLGGGGGGSGGGLLGSLGPYLSGGLDAAQQGKASDKMLGWMNSQQAKVDNLYAPGSPEYNALWDQMSRKDAAAGRNSQYGPRSVDLAARIAQIKAENTARMTTGLAGAYSGAFNQDASKYSGLMAALGNTGGGGGWSSIIGGLSGLLGGSDPSGLSGIENWDDIWEDIGGTDDFIDYGEFF